MKILVVGLNHKTAPVQVREKLAFDTEQSLAALRQLKSRFAGAEFVLLSTCNRVEVYSAGAGEAGVGAEVIGGFLSEFRGVGLDEFGDLIYVYEDEEAVKHLLTVVSGLDSMVVGEGEIAGQVKDSYRLACTARTTGRILNRLFHCAFGTGKKVHTATSISTGRVSVAGVAVEVARQHFADISSAKVVVIGAGEMGQLLVRHLAHEACGDITVVNRSYEKALETGRRYGVQAGRWEELEELLVGADIVISAAAEGYLFKKEGFAKIMARRRKGAILIIDIGVPRNFEPQVKSIKNVSLYSIDELSEAAEANRKAREGDITKGVEIVYQNVAEFMDWLKAGDIGPLIGQMREKFWRISREELERFFVGVRREAHCKEAAEAMVKRIVNRLLHCVILNVEKSAKERGGPDAAKLVEGIVRDAEEMAKSQGERDQ